jgi:hypothetical protein
MGYGHPMSRVDWDSGFFVLNTAFAILGVALFIASPSLLNVGVIVANAFAAWMNWRAIQRKYSPR